MLRNNSILIALIICTINIYANTSDTLIYARDLFSKGIEFGRSGKLDSAEMYSKEALVILSNMNNTDSVLLANTYLSLGIINKLKDQLDLSPMIFKKFIESSIKRENYLVNWIDRMNRTCTHQIDYLRTVISYAKSQV